MVFFFADFDIKFDKINLGYAVPPAALTPAIKSDAQDEYVVITFLFKHEYVLCILDLLLCFSYSTSYPVEHCHHFLLFFISTLKLLAALMLVIPLVMHHYCYCCC